MGRIAHRKAAQVTGQIADPLAQDAAARLDSGARDHAAPGHGADRSGAANGAVGNHLRNHAASGVDVCPLHHRGLHLTGRAQKGFFAASVDALLDPDGPALGGHPGLPQLAVDDNVAGGFDLGPAVHISADIEVP